MPKKRNGKFYDRGRAGLSAHKTHRRAFPASSRDTHSGPRHQRRIFRRVFLNRTNVRILIDFLDRTFRLRNCELDIDGSFPVPCTQYFAKRCLAPCVAQLCGEAEYAEMVRAARLFLLDLRYEFADFVEAKIFAASESLDFETAAKWRDIFQAVKDFHAQARWHVWLDKATDTYEVFNEPEGIVIDIVTHRERRSLGERPIFSKMRRAKTRPKY